MKKQLPNIPKLIRPYAVSGSKGFRLKHFDPGDTQGFDLKADADLRFLDHGEGIGFAHVCDALARASTQIDRPADERQLF